MKKELKNIPASILARLLTLNKKRGGDYNQLLVQFAIERLLYRLSCSKHNERFILKGAMLFPSWNTSMFRATRDLDLLGLGESSLNTIIQLFQEICSIEFLDDGIQYLSSSIKGEEIRALDEYVGVRIFIQTRIGTVRLQVQVDVGVGDSVVPPPDQIEYPTLLNLPRPRLKAYRPETVIAEKLHALVDHGLENTRMKDYYDLLFISRNFEFEGDILAKAIRATFKRRNTQIPLDPPLGLSSRFSEDRAKQLQWNFFQQKMVTSGLAASLPEAVTELQRFLLPPFRVAEDPTRHLGNWKPPGPWDFS